MVSVNLTLWSARAGDHRPEFSVILVNNGSDPGNLRWNFLLSTLNTPLGGVGGMLESRELRDF